MKLVCLMPVRNSAWVLGLSARAVLKWCDHLVVLDHASTDPTPAVLMELAEFYPDRMTVLNEPDPQWNEMAHRQRLLIEARQLGATHIAMVDDDEVLTANLLPPIRRYVEDTPNGAILQLPWIAMTGAIDQYRSSGVWSQQQCSIAFRDAREFHWAARNGYDFHHRHPMGLPFKGAIPIRELGKHGGLMHLQFASERRLRAKQALYKMTEVIRWPGREPVQLVDRRYNIAVYGHDGSSLQRAYRVQCGPDILDRAPAGWWDGYGSLMEYLHLDDEPWQEAEARRLWREYGPKKFEGLDLFGVI